MPGLHEFAFIFDNHQYKGAILNVFVTDQKIIAIWVLFFQHLCFFRKIRNQHGNFFKDFTMVPGRGLEDAVVVYNKGVTRSAYFKIGKQIFKRRNVQSSPENKKGTVRQVAFDGNDHVRDLTVT